MKTILLTGLAAVGLALTTTNSRADGFSLSISLGHHHHDERPVVVAPPPVVVQPAPVCEILPPPVYRPHDHHYTHWDSHHGWGNSYHGFRAPVVRHEQGYSSHSDHGNYERDRHGRRY